MIKLYTEEKYYWHYSKKTFEIEFDGDDVRILYEEGDPYGEFTGIVECYENEWSITQNHDDLNTDDMMAFIKDVIKFKEKSMTILKEYNKYSNVVSYLGDVEKPGEVIDVWLVHCSDSGGVSSHAIEAYPTLSEAQNKASESGYLSVNKSQAVASIANTWSIYSPLLNEDPKVVKSRALAKLTPEERRALGH